MIFWRVYRIKWMAMTSQGTGERYWYSKLIEELTYIGCIIVDRLLISFAVCIFSKVDLFIH